MHIVNTANPVYAGQRPQTASPAPGIEASSTTAPEKAQGAANGSSDIKQVDFTNMTRQEMFDWMNAQIRNREMSIEDSSPFLAMTIKIDEATGESIDMADDTTRTNYLERARLGIEGALWRGDQKAAERLQSMMDSMLKDQGRTISVDTYA